MMINWVFNSRINENSHIKRDTRQNSIHLANGGSVYLGNSFIEHFQRMQYAWLTTWPERKRVRHLYVESYSSSSFLRSVRIF